MTWAIIEKKNHNALHGVFESKERAEHHLQYVIPEYVNKSFFTDKGLTAKDFEITTYVNDKSKRKVKS